MIKAIGSQTTNIQPKAMAFKQEAQTEEKHESEKDKLMLEEKKAHPVLTSAGITTDKFQNALTLYPIKGFSGSKNANFYEFLTMGMVPFVAGGVMMVSLFNSATKNCLPGAAKFASRVGKPMALGVVFYAAAKTFTKALIEKPLEKKYGIDMNTPYRKVVRELPESADDKDLISHEYHKVFESVDFPRWDLLYNAKAYGDKTNSYYDMVAKKMGLGENLSDSDQQVKPKIKEKVIQARTFSTFASLLWAAVSVGVASQKPFANVFSKKPMSLFDGHFYKSMAKDFGKRFVDSCKAFYNGGPGNARSKVRGIAGKALLGVAAGVTLLGNIVTLSDSKVKKASKAAAAPIIDDNKAKVVC